MARKINDEEAFAFYIGMGAERSYRAVSRKYNVCPRAIRKAAKRGDWVARLDRIEKEAQVRADKKLAETLAQTRERHLQLCRAMQSRGAQAIKAHELEDAMQGAKTIEMAVKLERLILGDVDSRVAVNIDEVTRREVETFLAHPDEVEEPDGDEAE